MIDDQNAAVDWRLAVLARRGGRVMGGRVDALQGKKARRDSNEKHGRTNLEDTARGRFLRTWK